MPPVGATQPCIKKNGDKHTSSRKWLVAVNVLLSEKLIKPLRELQPLRRELLQLQQLHRQLQQRQQLQLQP